MSVNDEATLVIGAGNYFTGPVDTEVPEDLAEQSGEDWEDWENVGHTSLEDIFSMTSEGGEGTTLGTLQNNTLRTKYSSRTESMALTIMQFDTTSLKLYFGANAEVLSNGMIGVPENPEPTVTALLGVFLDQENVFGLWMPKCEIFRGEDLSASDTESLVGLNLAVKPLKSGSNKFTYAVTPLGDVQP